MSIDIIGNMLTAIRNAFCLKKRFVVVPHSKFKAKILQVLQSNGYIKGFDVIKKTETFGEVIKIALKYVEGESVIHVLKRVSKPSIRIYSKPDELKPVIGGLGLSVLTTSQGVLSDIQARKLGVGGEVLFTIW
jgi:small subunit ribosomal protein S8